ncbi:gastric triacylglycerol lipase-like [Bacillus rossius redtenbacheri]|uniref:gastric triacylglycerol lipase-like n=1 Tax=Bacillus rossius redtenbacheri TaxID=93214 RepID=UPI002FDD4AF1
MRGLGALCVLAALGLPASCRYDTDQELSTPDLVRKHGYPAESHVALTADGYLLTLHRIPHGRTRPDAGGRPVVFLQHGLLSSSADWVIMGPNTSLAYILADEGFDVWMGNVRGNTYSKSHVNLSSSDPLFWRFSWDEMAVFDLPAALDLVLATTGRRRLFYVGHSMGTSMFFALACTRPDYVGARVELMSALAPVVFLRHVRTPMRILSYFAHDYQFLAHFFGANQFLPNNFILRLLARYGCDAITAERKICESSIFVLTGFDPQQFNISLLPVILGHAPAGTSSRTIVHYAQLIQSGQFKPFDCQEDYKPCYQPPSGRYQLDNISVKVSLHYGDNDWLATPTDVHALSQSLRKVVGVYRVPLPTFNHVDFLWAKDVRALVYDEVVRLLKQGRG